MGWGVLLPDDKFLNSKCSQYALFLKTFRDLGGLRKPPETSLIIHHCMCTAYQIWFYCLFILFCTQQIETERLFSNISDIAHTNCSFWENYLSKVLHRARETRCPLNPSDMKEGFKQVIQRGVPTNITKPWSFHQGNFILTSNKSYSQNSTGIYIMCIICYVGRHSLSHSDNVSFYSMFDVCAEVKSTFLLEFLN